MVSLDLENITEYLLENGVLDVESIVDEDLAIERLPGRHENFRVVRARRHGFVVKQAYAALADADGSVVREAEFYSLIESDPLFEALRPYVPSLVSRDPDNQVLISRLLAGARRLDEYECAAPETSRNPAFLLGHALAICHSCFAPLLADSRTDFLPPYAAPNLGGVARPNPRILSEASQGKLKILSIVQHDRLLSRFVATVDQDWRIQTVIHGDLGKNNVLVQESPDGRVRMKIIDWELAGKGDAAWDIACALGDFLSGWVLTSYITKSMSVDEIVSRNAEAMLKFQSDARVFWYSYSRSSTLAADPGALLRRSARFLAGFLLQSAYRTVAALPDLLPHSLYLLQIGANIAQDVDRAIRDLLTIRDF